MVDSNKVFAVVEFLCRNEVDIVPEKWIFCKEENMHCFWPNLPSYKVRQLCLQYVDADINWMQYHIRIMYKTDDLAKAMLKLQLAECTSDLATTAVSEDNEDVIGRPKSKRRRKLLSRVASDSDEPSSNVIRVDQLQEETTSSTPRQRPPRAPSFPNSPVHESQLPETSIVADPSFSSVRLEEGTEVDRSSESLHGEGDRHVNITRENFISLQSEVRRIRITQLEIKHQLASLHKKLDLLTSSKSTGECQLEGSPAELPSLPINSMMEFEELEQELESIDVQKKLTSYLSKFTSMNYKRSVRQMLSSLLSDALMNEFNWMGQRGSKRPIKNCKIVSIIYASIKTCRYTKETTNDSMKIVIQQFLKASEKRINSQSKATEKETLAVSATN